jgi:hypothetical protein
MTAGARLDDQVKDAGERCLPAWPNKYARGWPAKPTSTGFAPAEIFALKFPTDVHFAAYFDVGHRVTIDALRAAAVVAEMALFIVDLDAHKLGSSIAWRDAVQERLLRLDGQPFGYWTRGGARVAWHLPSPVRIASCEDAHEWTAFYRSTLIDIAATCGVIGDPACCDFGRLFRAPHATRDGAAQDHGVACGNSTRFGVLPKFEVSFADRLVAEAALIEQDSGWARARRKDVIRATTSPAASRVAKGTSASRGPGTHFVYARRALEHACASIARAPKGTRNSTLAAEAFSLGQLVGADLLSAEEVTEALLRACERWEETDRPKCHHTIQRQIVAGAAHPRRLEGGR